MKGEEGVYTVVFNTSSGFTLHSDCQQQLLAAAQIVFQHKGGHMAVLMHRWWDPKGSTSAGFSYGQTKEPGVWSLQKINGVRKRKLKTLLYCQSLQQAVNQILSHSILLKAVVTPEERLFGLSLDNIYYLSINT